MRALLAFSRGVDRLNERVGGAVAWLTLAMILIGAYNAVVRYLGRYIGRDLSSNTYVELQWYLFSLVFLLGGAWTLKHGGHVRVDVVYGRLSARARAWIDVAGTVLFLLPFCALMLVLA
jgi:TRAP-type mannitol/chloroaromatic compound transport system permease small subunit